MSAVERTRITPELILKRIANGETDFKDLEIGDLTTYEINGVRFVNCGLMLNVALKIDGCTFIDCNLGVKGFGQRLFLNSHFLDCDITKLSGRFAGTSISGGAIKTLGIVYLSGLDITVENCDVGGCVFIDCHSLGIDKVKSTWGDTAENRRWVEFDRVSFARIEFPSSFQGKISECKFGALSTAPHTKFIKVQFAHTNIANIFVTPETEFQACSFNAFTLAKIQLATMRDSGITKGQMRDITVLDDIADLKMKFSGLLGVSHWVSAFAFAAPYLWFVCVKWASNSQWDTATRSFKEAGGEKRELLYQLAKYIWEGKEIACLHFLRLSWLANTFFWFCIFACYTTARILLVWKTMKLEHQEKVLQSPVDFSLIEKRTKVQENCFMALAFSIASCNKTLTMVLRKRWYLVFQLVSWGFYAALLSTLFHSIGFLMTKVPL